MSVIYGCKLRVYKLWTIATSGQSYKKYGCNLLMGFDKLKQAISAKSILCVWGQEPTLVGDTWEVGTGVHLGD